MKTFKHLYPTITSFDNLLLAFRKARRGKRGRPDVAAIKGYRVRNREKEVRKGEQITVK